MWQLISADQRSPWVPDVQEGDKLTLEGVEPVQHFTKPLGHFSEASLVKAMEEHGIGRPATYASTLKTLQV